MGRSAIGKAQKPADRNRAAEGRNDAGVIHRQNDRDRLSLSQALPLSGDKKSSLPYFHGMAKGGVPLSPGARRIVELTAKRIGLLADLHAMGPTEMERCLGLSHGHWRHLIQGSRQLSVEIAFRLCEQFGVTLDWIYRGRAASQVRPDVLVNVVALAPLLTELPDMAESMGIRR